MSNNIFLKGLKSLKQNGIEHTLKKVMVKLFKIKQLDSSDINYIVKKELRHQRKYRFEKSVKISILVPLYNTPENFLRKMIESVISQTYTEWELCLADGSESNCKKIEKICLSYANNDARIKYIKTNGNRGISGNTNACIEKASGEYFALLDHDDVLYPGALFEVARAICEKGAEFIYTDENTFSKSIKDAYRPHFKPDYAPDTLRSYNYIGHLIVFSRGLMERAGGALRSQFDGSQDYELILRLTEKTDKIVHVPKILYYWRAHDESTAKDAAAKLYVNQAAIDAISEHLKRCGLDGTVQDSTLPTTYRIKYKIKDEPLVSIILPNKDNADILDKCLRSVLEKSTYRNFEIIIVENNSTDEETFEYYNSISDDRVQVVKWEGIFNYSAINNFAASKARGEYLLLLNNDTEIITPDWIQEMLMFAQRSDVGAVGAMLYYPDDTIQHAGVIIGLGGVAGHSHKFYQRGDSGYMSRLSIAQNYSSVTAACIMIRHSVYFEVGGLDEAFAVAFNDVDLCVRIRKAGYLIVWTPYAELYHYESKTRGYDDTPQKKERFIGEIKLSQRKWKKELDAGDPYYNKNLTLDREDFSLK